MKKTGRLSVLNVQGCLKGAAKAAPFNVEMPTKAGFEMTGKRESVGAGSQWRAVRGKFSPFFKTAPGTNESQIFLLSNISNKKDDIVFTPKAKQSSSISKVGV